MVFSSRPPDATRTLRALARLLCYPDAELREHLFELRDALRAGRAVSSARLAELDALVDGIARAAPLDAEAAYVQLFDRGRATSLHLFEHVHGDSRERGPALIDLARCYAQAGLYLAPGELPDYLPVVLEFASTQPAREARAFLGEIAHILNALFNALRQRRSAYAAVIGALLELAGEQAHPVEVAPDEPLDATWSEPPAFDGCAVKGQSRPEPARPIPVTVKNRAATGAP